MPAYELLLISKCDCVDRFQLIFFQIKHKLLKTLGVNTVITYFFFLSSNNDKTIKVESQNYVYKRERFCYNDEIMFSEKLQTPTAIDRSIEQPLKKYRNVIQNIPLIKSYSTRVSIVYGNLFIEIVLLSQFKNIYKYYKHLLS